MSQAFSVLCFFAVAVSTVVAAPPKTIINPKTWEKVGVTRFPAWEKVGVTESPAKKSRTQAPDFQHGNEGKSWFDRVATQPVTPVVSFVRGQRPTQGCVKGRRNWLISQYSSKPISGRLAREYRTAIILQTEDGYMRVMKSGLSAKDRQWLIDAKRSARIRRSRGVR